MRRLLIALAALVALLAASGTALGHAYVVSSSPAADSRLGASPALVTLTFNEPVQLLRSEDLDVVDEQGNPVNGGPGRRTANERVLEVPLRPGLPEGTYTVRYSIIGADSHVIPGRFVFGVGPGELAEPFLGGGGTAGPSETGVWGVSSRFLEVVGIGGLLGLLAFRWLVWAPALGRVAGISGSDRTALLTWGRDAFWVGFGVLAVGAMLAEGYLLVVQSASALGVGVLDALRDASGISDVLGNTRFGSLVQLRGALLFGLFAIGAIQFMREYGNSQSPRPPSERGALIPALLMAALLGSVLGGISAQGHAAVASLSALQIGSQILHVVAVSVWITGLLLVVVVHFRAPRIAARGGPMVAAQVLARFSKVALGAVALAVATGVVRTIGELSDPSELWDTAYGRSIVFKLLLLCPIALLALYNRRVVTALRDVPSPNGATLRLVQRTAGLELALSLAIVVVASLLVAQVPGGAR